MARSFLIIAIVTLAHHTAEAGFTQGAPCSSRNTAYLNPSKAFFPPEPVHCVDVTGMDTALTFNPLWPLSTATTLYGDRMHLKTLNVTMFTFMPNLEVVDLTGNEIRRMPYVVDVLLPKLRVFLLARNSVRVPKKRPLMRSATVETLMLSRNGIREIRQVTFAKVPVLKVLYLDSNRLKFVTAKMFGWLQNLKYLHLGNNLLKSVPQKVEMPVSLKVYITKGNPLEEENDLLAR